MNATKQKSLRIAQNTTPEFYDFGTVQVIKTRKDTIQNRIEARLRKAFVRKEAGRYLYNIQVENRTQSNVEGKLGIENALSFLLKRLVLFTNAKGEIVEIINQQQIKETWYRKRENFIRQFNPITPNLDGLLAGIDAFLDDQESFRELVEKSEIYTLLFPPVYQQKLAEKKIIKQEKDFYDFFDEHALTLKVNTVLKGLSTETEAGTTQIVRSGTLDQSRFETSEVKEQLRTLYETPNLSVEINADYLEGFDLDSLNNVYAGTQLLNIEIKHIYNLRQYSKIKRV